MNVAVIGSRAYGDLLAVERLVRRIAHKYPDATIISGGAQGVDQAAARAAHQLSLRVREIRPDWLQGKHAGLLRNSAIVEASDVVCAFWNGDSAGTADTIKKAMAARKLRYLAVETHHDDVTVTSVAVRGEYVGLRS